MSEARRKVLFVGPGSLLQGGAGGERLVAGVIPALLRLRDAGYELVLVAGDDPADPRWLEVLDSQGVRLANGAADGALDWLRRGDLDRAASAVVGPGSAAARLAGELGVPAYRIAPGGDEWPALAHRLADRPRTAVVERATRETRIRAEVDLDREAAAEVGTGIGFFDHMLEQLGRHGGFALRLRCDGDTRVDEHHTVEDSALALGEALRRALGDKRGIARYGFALPMDESRAEALLDLSGRAYFVFEGRFGRERVGELPTELVPHFFRSLSDALGANLHLRVAGENAHHMVEACFKVVARALRMAIRHEGGDVPSTKGVL